MAISLHRKLSGQNLLRPIESNLWKIGAPFIDARQPQRRPFFHLASQLGKKNKKITKDFNFLIPNLYRHFSSSSLLYSKTGFLKWYLQKLDTNPIITKSISASLIYTSADITSQMITMQPDESFDLFRMTRLFTYALLITGPCQHYWFGYLSKIMPQKNLFTTLSKMLMGQAIYGPCMNTIFFSYNATLRGENGHEIVARLKRDLLPTLKNSIVYWPICDFMTFMFVPVNLQPLVTSSLAYLWLIYLSYMASLNKVGGADERSEHALAKRATNHNI